MEKTMKEKSKDSPIWKKVSDAILAKDTLLKFNVIIVMDIEYKFEISFNE
jgi:hypothetical protein